MAKQIVRINTTQKEANLFCIRTVELLARKGFHVRSLQEALSCIDFISTEATILEIDQAMQYPDTDS